MRVLAALFAVVLAGSAFAESPCSNVDFELSEQCVASYGVAGQLATFKERVVEAQRLYGTRYEVRVHAFGSTSYSKFNGTTDDVFSYVATDENLLPEALDIYVKWTFLAQQPEVLFEHAARHEVAHMMNGDVPGYRPNGASTEAAAEHRVLELVGEAHYREYLRAYREYQPTQVKDIEAFVHVVRAATPKVEERIDDADRKAAEYFRTLTDGKEHLLIYDGAELHDVTRVSDAIGVQDFNVRAFDDMVARSTSIVIFHNHPLSDVAKMYPSPIDFGGVPAFLFDAFTVNPNIRVEFRLIQIGSGASIEYGLRSQQVQKFKEMALAMKADPSKEEKILDELGLRRFGVRMDSLYSYIAYAAVPERDVGRVHETQIYEGLTVHPKYFIRSNENYFLRYRGSIQAP